MWIYTAVDFLGDLSHGNNHKIWGKMTGLEESSALGTLQGLQSANYCNT